MFLEQINAPTTGESLKEYLDKKRRLMIIQAFFESEAASLEMEFDQTNDKPNKYIGSDFNDWLKEDKVLQGMKDYEEGNIFKRDWRPKSLWQRIKGLFK